MISERGLKSGTTIYDRYVVEDVLGEGGFGITYLAVEQDSGEQVAVKEYFPLRLAVRQRENGELSVAVGNKAEYERGKARFINEASILKEFGYLQGIVRVWDCFEANHTAYIVMDYIDGVTLREYISGHGSMDYAELMEMLSPILKSLVTLHRHGVIHRDISPDNLMIGMDNHMYLIDFGAAKEMERETTTVLLKAGYAPPEQYLHDGELGAWTDVYALCATIYTALCGKAPADAVARLQGKDLLPLSGQGVKLAKWQWDAIAKGMSMRAAERFRDVGALYDALTAAPTDEELPTAAGGEIEPQIQEELQKLNKSGGILPTGRRKHRGRLAMTMVLAVCIVSAAVYFGTGLQGDGKLNLSGWSVYPPAAEEEDTADGMEDTADSEETEAAAGSEETKAAADGNGIAGTADKEEQQAASEEIPRLCRMPDVAGLNQDTAAARIASIDKVIKVRIIRQYSDSVARDTVIAQNVAPDTQYNEGAIEEIVLTVSDGAKPAAQADKKTAAGKTKSEQDSYQVESDGNEAVDFYLND
ncbi:MAG: serine/threonine-protein kinase [Clostridium sp.]|nr:serine/threonine-protein kinase [Clostridium sp.]